MIFLLALRKTCGCQTQEEYAVSINQIVPGNFCLLVCVCFIASVLRQILFWLQNAINCCSSYISGEWTGKWQTAPRSFCTLGSTEDLRLEGYLSAADRTFLHRNPRYEVWQIRDVYQESKYLNAYQGWSSVKVFFHLAVSSVRNCPKACLQEAEIFKTEDQQEVVIIFRWYEQWSSSHELRDSISTLDSNPSLTTLCLLSPDCIGLVINQKIGTKL